MIGVTATVTGSLNVPAIRREIDREAQAAVRAGARSGGLVARAVSRKKSGRMAAIMIESPRASELGWQAGFVSPARHAWYQNEGTLASRGVRRIRRGPPAVKTGPGIKPSYFLFQGLGAGKVAMCRSLGIPVMRRG